MIFLTIKLVDVKIVVLMIVTLKRGPHATKAGIRLELLVSD